MTTDIDDQLTIEQWTALKALRPTGPASVKLGGSMIEQLIALDLAAINDGHPVITEQGRKVVLRGSPRLWDLAA
jgi:hypothetical protein